MRPARSCEDTSPASDSGRVRTDREGLLSGPKCPPVRDVNLRQYPFSRSPTATGERGSPRVREARFTESLACAVGPHAKWISACICTRRTWYDCIASSGGSPEKHAGNSVYRGMRIKPALRVQAVVDSSRVGSQLPLRVIRQQKTIALSVTTGDLSDRPPAK